MNTVGRPGFAGLPPAGAIVPPGAAGGAALGVVPAAGVAGLAAALAPAGGLAPAAAPAPAPAAAPAGALAPGGLPAHGALPGPLPGVPGLPGALHVGAPGGLHAALGAAPIGALAVPPAPAPGAAALGVAAPAVAGVAGGLAGPVAAPQPPLVTGDARTQPISFDSQGTRHKAYREALLSMREDPFADWPLRGPRTCLWCLRFMEQHGGTPLGHHSKWRTEFKLSSSDYGVEEHERCARMIEHMVVYDQLMVTNLVACESMCRCMQSHEQRYRDRSVSSASESVVDNHLFLGTDMVRGNVMISPKLQEFFKEELARESQIAKELRKAREERALAKPKKKGQDKDNKGGGGGDT